MKLADIEPGKDYAVRVPAHSRGRDPRVAIRCIRVKAVEGRYVKVGSEHRLVHHNNVLSTWEDHLYGVAWDEAHAENAMRDRMAEDHRERRARAELWEREILPAFKNLMVPAEALSKANYERPNEDLSDALRDTFVYHGAVGATFGADVFIAVARRINELSEIVTQNALVAEED
jgi:hypothetical protein